jgi:nucleoside-diphosphate-sugar epimerase
MGHSETGHKEKRILVTGASGFIGSHVLRLLVHRGYDATGQVRETSNLFRLQDPFRTGETRPFPLFFTSLEQDLKPMLEGVDTVVHTAALARDWGPARAFVKTNVEGTARLAEAAVSAGVRRLIHLSSTVVYGFGGQRDTGEEAGYRPFPHPYCTSKVDAERVLLASAGRLELFILRPSNVYGPLDTSFTLPLFRALHRGLPAFPAGGRPLTSPCFVDNLTHAVMLCLEAEPPPAGPEAAREPAAPPPPGGTGTPIGSLPPGAGVYNVSDGADLPWRRFLEIAAGELGVRPPFLPVPVGPLMAAARVLSAAHRVLRTGRPPIITPYRMAQVSRDYSFSIERASRQMG